MRCCCNSASTTTSRVTWLCSSWVGALAPSLPQDSKPNPPGSSPAWPWAVHDFGDAMTGQIPHLELASIMLELVERLEEPQAAR